MEDRLKDYVTYLQNEIKLQDELARVYSSAMKSVRAQGKSKALEEAVKILYNIFPEIKP